MKRQKRQKLFMSILAGFLALRFLYFKGKIEQCFQFLIWHKKPPTIRVTSIIITLCSVCNLCETSPKTCFPPAFAYKKLLPGSSQNAAVSFSKMISFYTFMNNYPLN